MPVTTWSTTDKVNVTLSGSNLIATASGTNWQLRGKDPKRTGKYYFEMTPTVFASGNSFIGLATPGAAPNLASSAPGCFGVYQGGSIYLGASAAGASLGAIAANNVVGIAIDLGAALGWMRVAPSGNWNGSASANPATGVGGLSVATLGLGGAFSAYPFAGGTATAESITANFGGGAFSGAVPAGFTSGWDDSTAAVTYEVATQIAAEHWAANAAPQLQLTQALIEQWASAAASPPQMVASQVLLEQWATVAAASASGDARAWILA